MYILLSEFLRDTHGLGERTSVLLRDHLRQVRFASLRGTRADYLLKPISAARFEESIEQPRGRRSESGLPPRPVPPPQTHLTRPAVKNGSTVQMTPTVKPDRVEATERFLDRVAKIERCTKEANVAVFGS